MTGVYFGNLLHGLFGSTRWPLGRHRAVWHDDDLRGAESDEGLRFTGMTGGTTPRFLLVAGLVAVATGACLGGAPIFPAPSAQSNL